ncbi:MAG: GMC family oxidoreductase N-terminal domain-containing protein [Rhizobiaceae bacterium]|nr:GMC family oxidoreductase N-terminal domain-containing protein [Rhizobiaceae bacterium]
MAKLHFDVAVIGAGSAGCVVASRLSEDASRRVGLIEAGDWPSDPDIADPLKWPALQNRAYDWAYRTVPQPFTAGRVHEWARGRIVGGSSCLHAMAHVRGHPDDFDAWARVAGDEWSFDALRPYFARSESFSGQARIGRGANGPLAVHLPDEEVSPVVRAYMAAGNALGAPKIEDHNAGPLTGTSANSLTIRDGRRASLADAYLTPRVRARPNLTIVTRTEIERLEFDAGRLSGASAVGPEGPVSITADRYVLCLGAIATPLLLMRSGIGDPAILAAAGIRPRLDRRQVGANLQDHLLGLGNVYRSSRTVPPSRLQHSESLMYLHSEDIARADGSPDIVLACVVAPSVADGLQAPAYGSAFTLLFGVCHPTSRGRIVPAGAGRNDLPLIDPRYLETEDDRLTFRRAFRMARQVGHHPALAEWREAEALPGRDVQTDAEIDAFIAQCASTHHHPCGTCRMGLDAEAVVAPDLRLNGVGNAFVVDASVIPTIPSGPINAAVVAIAEAWSARIGAAG